MATRALISLVRPTGDSRRHGRRGSSAVGRLGGWLSAFQRRRDEDPLFLGCEPADLAEPLRMRAQALEIDDGGRRVEVRLEHGAAAVSAAERTGKDDPHWIGRRSGIPPGSITNATMGARPSAQATSVSTSRRRDTETRAKATSAASPEDRECPR